MTIETVETQQTERDSQSQSQQIFTRLKQSLSERILGQERLVDRLLIALLADGHMLVEGAPGLAKTTAIKELAAHLEADFSRLQFTPDLLPSDLTGTDIYRPQSGEFEFQQGPLFHNLVLADEVNRAPAKVQSALLEAMGERQITVGRTTYALPQLFLVMATQNPIEQEGTYPLPEAQLDRFLLYVRIDYPEAGTERDILRLAREQESLQPAAVKDLISDQQVFEARQEIMNLHISEALEDYIVQLVLTSRNPALYDDKLARLVDYGASPRGTIALERCARAHAWLQGHDYVSPADVQEVAHDVLRHRILLSYAAEAEGLEVDQFIDELIARVPVA